MDDEKSFKSFLENNREEDLPFYHFTFYKDDYPDYITLVRTDFVPDMWFIGTFPRMEKDTAFKRLQELNPHLIISERLESFHNGDDFINNRVSVVYNVEFKPSTKA